MTGARLRLEPARPGQISEVLEALAAIPARFTNNEQHKVGDRIRLGIARNFTREGPQGLPWPGLAYRTVEDRRALGFAGEHPILQRTRELKRSWTERGHRHNVEAWSVAGSDVTLEIASTDPRSDKLAGGDPAENLPPRPMHLLGDDDLQGLGDTLAWCVETVARRGL